MPKVIFITINMSTSLMISYLVFLKGLSLLIE